VLKTYWSMSLHRADHGHVRALPTDCAIRPLRLPDDVAPVAALYGLAFGEEPWDLEWCNFAGFDAEGVFLTWRGDELAGFVISYVQPAHFERGYISVMATAPGHRRRGIASALMSAVLDRFWGMGFDQAAIDVAEDNPAAIAAYEKIGFRKVGELIADATLRSSGAPPLRSTSGHCRVPPESAGGLDS
jgi:ribosomal protein S18 acetylase RimI-like enzyme